MDELPKHLPEDIRVFDAIHSSKRFDAGRWCDSRTYNYYLPVWMLKPLKTYPQELQDLMHSTKQATVQDRMKYRDCIETLDVVTQKQATLEH